MRKPGSMSSFSSRSRVCFTVPYQRRRPATTFTLSIAQGPRRAPDGAGHCRIAPSRREGSSAYNRADGCVETRSPVRPGRIQSVTERLDLPRLRIGLLAFWALYFAIVALSNLTDLLRGVGVLAADWHWISGNL